MYLTVDVLPEDVVGAIAVEVPGTHELPVRSDRRKDIDTALALAVQHWPVMYLAVDVLPQHVASSNPDVVDRRPKHRVAEAGSSIGPTGCGAPAVGVNADRDVGALDDHGTPGIATLGVGVIPQNPRVRAPSVLAERTAMSLLGLVLGVARSTRTEVRGRSVDAITGDPNLRWVVRI